jgi:hypothetical protein
MSLVKTLLRSCPFVSLYQPVDALNRAALDQNGNSRSGWHQQLGNTKKTDTNGHERRRRKAKELFSKQRVRPRSAPGSIPSIG